MSQESLENLDGKLTPELQQSSAEKMIPQSKVEELIVNAKYEAAEKARRQMQQQSQQQNQNYQQASQQQTASHSFGGMPDVRSIVADEFGRHFKELSDRAQQEQLESQGRQLYEDFSRKIVNSPSYDENKDAFQKLAPSLPNIAPIVYLANSIDNTSDVMLELAKNPSKIAQIMQLAQIDPDLNLASAEMYKLSESIKTNAAAKAMALPNEPMSQLKSSPNSTDGGSRTVTDWRKIYR